MPSLDVEGVDLSQGDQRLAGAHTAVGRGPGSLSCPILARRAPSSLTVERDLVCVGGLSLQSVPHIQGLTVSLLLRPHAQ